MAVEIGALRAMLSLDSAAFERGAKRAQASMGNMQRRLSQLGGGLKKFGRGMSARVTAPLALAAGAAVRSSLRTVDAQAKFAESLDTTVVSVQNLKRASDLAGISQGDLDGSLRRMTRRLSLAERGTGAAVKALDLLSLSASDLADMPVDERIKLINNRIRDMIPAAEQAGVASEIFGDKTGLAMLRLNPDVIERASDEVKRFGAAMSEVAAKDIQAANDSIGMIGLAMRGLSNQLTAALAPAIKTAAEAIAGAVEWFSKLSSQMQTTIGVLTAVAAAIGPVSLALGLMVSGLRLAVGGVVALTGALRTMRGVMITTGIGAVAVALGVLAERLFQAREESSGLSTAADNVSLALGDEITQSQLLSTALGTSTNMSVSAAKEKLKEARARHENVQAIIEEHKALALSSDSYSILMDEIKVAEDAARSVGFPAIDASTMMNAEAFENAQLRLVELRKEQQRMLEAGEELTDQFQRSGENINELETALENAKGGMVSFGDSIVEPVKLSERLTAASGGAKTAIDEVGDSVGDLGDKADQAADRFGDMVARIVTGSLSIGDAVKNMASRLISSGISSGISGLAKGDGFLATIAGAFAGAFDGGGLIPAGQFGIAGERGPEIVRGPAQVTSRVDTARMMGGGGSVVNNISITAPPGSEVQEDRRQNRSGGEDLTIMIDKAVSGLARDPGSNLSRTLGSNFGLKPTTRGR